MYIKIPGNNLCRECIMNIPDFENFHIIPKILVIWNTYLWRSNAFVQSSIIGMDAGNIEIRHDVSINGHVLSHLKPLCVGQLLAIQFPGYFRCWVTTGRTFEKNARSWLKSLLIESRSYLWWFNCKISKTIKKPIWPLLFYVLCTYIVLPVSVLPLLGHFLGRFWQNTDTCLCHLSWHFQFWARSPRDPEVCHPSTTIWSSLDYPWCCSWR